MNYFSFLFFSLLFCCTPMAQTDQDKFIFLALGDSYTIGESVSEAERWPMQLVTRLRKIDIGISNPNFIATTGWTTDELKTGIEEASISETYDLVSLLIGVNNQYRGLDIEIYKKEFAALLDQAIGFVGGKAENVFVLSIPDYGVTPFARDNNLDPLKISSELSDSNTDAKAISNSRGVVFFEITEWSRNAAHDPSLVASAGLHPSGTMYENWTSTCWYWGYQNFADR